MAKQAFLINAPKRRRRKTATKARKTSRRKSTARKSVPAWVKSKGYSSWGAYMASIRPSQKGGKVAKRRKRRASAARPVARRRRRRATYRRNPPVAYAANPRRRRRRSYRRNPPRASIGNIPSMLMNAGVNAVGVVAGKAGARIGRAQLKMEQGTPVGFMTELGIGVAGGILLQRVNRNFATMFTTGAMVSVIEGVVKQFNVPLLSSALGDEGELNLISGNDDITRYLNRGGNVAGYEMADASGLGEYELQEA